MKERSHFFGGIELRDVSQSIPSLRPPFKKYWKRFALAYLALFAAMVMNLLKPWPLKIIFDYILLNKTMPPRLELVNSLAGQDKLVLLALLCASIVGYFFWKVFFTFIRKYFLAGAGERAINDIRQRVFGHLQMLEHRTDRSADLVVRLTSDIDSLKLLADRTHSDLCELFFHFCRNWGHHVFDGLAAYPVGPGRGSAIISPITLFFG